MNKWQKIGLVVGVLAAVVGVVLPQILMRTMRPPVIGLPLPATSDAPGQGPFVVDALNAVAKNDYTAFLGTFDGKFESSGAGGTWTLEKSVCHSGERDGFFGVRLTTTQDDGLQVKLVKDPIKGWSVIANEPEGCKSTSTGKCSARLYEPDDCSTLEINLSVSPNMRSQFFRGTVSIDCSYHGARLVGQGTIARCGRG